MLKDVFDKIERMIKEIMNRSERQMDFDKDK
jgi:hypothetical protein